MRILIIEDEIIIARFMEQQLKSHFDCDIRIALSTAEAALEMEQYSPHLLLCDINLNEDENGIQLISNLQRQYLFEVIFITSYQSKSIIEEAALTKPANYIIKPVDEVQLFAGVQLVLTRLNGNPPSGKKQAVPMDVLNNTEREIIRFIAQKKTTKEIAQMLFLSPHTIKNHRHNICRKLQLEDENNALLTWVLQQGGNV
jgi:DNA-binding NarL/FixJ family response regulator